MKFEVMTGENYEEPPEDGVYVNGMFLEGARWDKRTGELGEQIPKQLSDPVPIVRRCAVKKM